MIPRLAADFLKKMALDARLKIVVLGPGKTDSAYVKREQIRSELKSEFPNSEVCFPEDSRISRATASMVGTDVIAQEQLLLSVADVIVALDMSQGVGEEISKYITNPGIAGKMILLAPEKYKNSDSFPAQVRKAIPETRKQWFSTHEFAICAVARILSPQAVRAKLLVDRGLVS